MKCRNKNVCGRGLSSLSQPEPAAVAHNKLQSALYSNPIPGPALPQQLACHFRDNAVGQRFRTLQSHLMTAIGTGQQIIFIAILLIP